MKQYQGIGILVGALALSSLLLSFGKPASTVLPRFWFEPNSSKLMRDTTWYMQHDEVSGPGEALDVMVQVMTDNPGTTVQIQGHSDASEPNVEGLALERAEKIQSLIAARGIPLSRLVAVTMGSSEPLVGADAIAQLRSETERNAACQANRRVDMKILSWNWKP
jgi:hypothetical protein